MATLSARPETLSSNKERVIEELVQGQESATQLQILFQKPNCEEEGGGRFSVSSAEELLEKILRSFNGTLSMLSSVGSVEVVSQNQATSNEENNYSPCWDDRRSEDSSESRKRPASAKDKRGCYKRKRAAQTWTKVSATIDDGHAWRKYGQKEILNSKHPRSYFRCTRKYDQGCKAARQVQRMEDDSQMYQITYIGTHTCRDSFRTPQIITDSNQAWESYNDMVASACESKIAIKQQHHHHHHHHHHQQLQQNSSITPTVKEETKEERTPSDLTTDDLGSNMIMWKDIMGDDHGFEYSSDYGDVGVSKMYSCSTEITSRNFEYDLGIRPIDDQFDPDDFHFE